jgi:transposase-like protein
VKVWENAWEEFTPFLRFDPEIRAIIYTTNSIESLNAGSGERSAPGVISRTNKRRSSVSSSPSPAETQLASGVSDGPTAGSQP